MPRRVLPALIVSALAVALSASPALAVTTAGEDAARGGGRIFIDFVRYDPAGRDGGSNSHVNKEVVQVKNGTNQRRNLAGWTIRDQDGHRYRFPRTSVGRNKTVTLHTGNGRDHGLQRYWDMGFYVWNNDGDRATLRDRNGRVKDYCNWGDGRGSTGC